MSQNTTPLSSASPLDATDVIPKETVNHAGRSARIGLWALGIGFGGFLLWAGLAPLDEGVPGQGMVTLDTKSKTVQHLTGGLIKEILVGEGDHVQEGQLLIRLDEAVARANFEGARQRYVGLRAMEGRLLAEQRSQSKISFHPDVIEASQDPQIREVVRTQEQLFDSRRAALQADLQSTEESIQGQLALIQAYEGMMVNRKNQQSLLTEELNNTRGLVKEGYAPRNRQLELERMASESSSGIVELQGNTLRAKRAVAELKQRIIVRQQEYRKDVEAQLAEVGREVPGDEEKYRVSKGDLGRIAIKSPATGQVVGLAFQTVGGVIGPGQKLMDIVPEDQTLLVEARVAPHLIDRVTKGLPVDVRFSSFAHTPQLVVQGKVVSISGDLLVDQHTGAGYYLARVAVTADGYKKLGKRQLQPGMPVEVVFITGERSMLTYLLNPLTKRIAASMNEE
ncbi:MAG: HlyD family type I secretion periplasmic adaptor subunit [Rhodoferax sp.]|nr:HlyD family type I secretion periplasmic adaptor subunit [Rhodoferax sp.]MBP7492895.1 HlyD family type I secretion periplasmic adaptor subunit [Rhodoferax sp.]